MSNITVANRKFLEKQVKSVLNEFRGEMAKKWIEFNADLWQGMLSGLVDLGNFLVSNLLYHGVNLDRALKTLNLPDEAGGEQNQKDLQEIKDFLSIFDALAPTEGRWSDGNIISPKYQAESRYFLNYVKRANDLVESKRRWGRHSWAARLKGEEIYSKLYDQMTRRGRVSIRMRGIAIDKSFFEQQGFFKKMSEINMPLVNASLLFLRPFYYETIEFDPSFQSTTQESYQEMIDDYKQTFITKYNDKSNSTFSILFQAFKIASIADPSAQHSLTEWFWAVKTKTDKGSGPEGTVSAIGSSIPWLAYALGEYSFIEKTIGKITSSKNPHKFTSLPAILVLVYDVFSPLALTRRSGIKDIIQETINIIEDIEKTKDSSGSWIFTDSENKKWKTKFLEVNALLQKYHQGFMRDNAWSSIDAKLYKYKNYVVPAFKYLSETSISNINSNNIEDIKAQLKKSVSTIEQHFDKTSGTSISGPAIDALKENIDNNKKILTEDRKKLKNYFNKNIIKYIKNKKGKHDYSSIDSPITIKSRIEFINKILDVYKLDSRQEIISVRRELIRVAKQAKALKSTKISKGKLRINFNNFILRNKNELGLNNEDFLQIKGKGLKDDQWSRGGIILDLPGQRTEAIQVVYFSDVNKKDRDSFGFHYGQGAADRIDAEVNSWLYHALSRVASTKNANKPLKPYMRLSDYLPLTYEKCEINTLDGVFIETFGTTDTWAERGYLEASYDPILKPDYSKNVPGGLERYFIDLYRATIQIHLFYLYILGIAEKYFMEDIEQTNKLISSPKVPNQNAAAKKMNALRKIILIDKMVADIGIKAKEIFNSEQ